MYMVSFNVNMNHSTIQPTVFGFVFDFHFSFDACSDITYSGTFIFFIPGFKVGLRLKATKVLNINVSNK